MDFWIGSSSLDVVSIFSWRIISFPPTYGYELKVVVDLDAQLCRQSRVGELSASLPLTDMN